MDRADSPSPRPLLSAKHSLLTGRRKKGAGSELDPLLNRDIASREVPVSFFQHAANPADRSWAFRLFPYLFEFNAHTPPWVHFILLFGDGRVSLVVGDVAESGLSSRAMISFLPSVSASGG